MAKKESFSTIRDNANRYFLMKMMINLLLIIMGSIFIALFLRQMQNQLALKRQRENSEIVLQETIEALSLNEQDVEELTAIFHNGNQSTIYDLNALITGGFYDSLRYADLSTRSNAMQDISERSGVSYLLVIDDSGRVLFAPEKSYFLQSVTDLGLISESNLDLLIRGTKSEDGTVTPAEEHNENGNFYFYSAHIEGTSRTIVLGTEVHALDVQISSLKDVGRIIGSRTVNGDGFLFAANADDHSFLYYKNGSDELTGSSTASVGLTDRIYKDGYAGMETINGIEYYCVSRKFNDSVCVCAIASSTGIYSSGRSIIAWSIITFVIVMLLCLSYALLLREDFVNHKTKTQRIVLIKNKQGKPRILYDRTLGKRLFPLMLIGVLVLFGVSLYAQTLLEISGAVTDSRIAINEAASRYAESIDSRKFISDYYDSWFLSKANLLSFLIEEDPSVLNEASDSFYTVYDENGIKHYLTDDEGNPLRSVRRSSVLTKLCDTNMLESINVFDSNGRKIATNREDWYFTLSFNPEDQSYPFRDVVDGKKDYLVQDTCVSDDGVLAKYIGVDFNYYTKVGPNGETVYASRSEYNNSLDSYYTGNPITPHRSMLQIGLKPEIVERLMASTSPEYIFSTDTLDGGFIVLFDSTEEHRIVYSPIASSIGKTAEEIGISSKAFSGDYYGFQKANGIDYFQYYFYNDGYYIATAIPRSGLYSDRFPIALLTACVSLFMIMFLSITVTFTTPNEEILYARVSERFKDLRSNSVFTFRTVHGKTVSTVQASARWDYSRIPWKSKTPEQKLISFVSVVVGLLIVYVLTSLEITRRTGMGFSVVNYIISGTWDRGINIFALSACALLLAFTALAISITRIPIHLITSILGTRSETIGHLILSVIKYGGTLASVFFALYMLGLDASSLVASAGILSLVIGLGAQSFIKDIIAGIFIVFEGEFRVGDIITIGDFRGTVVDIGLRTTKIINGVGNIKIFNNSEITSVVNMTKQNSIAVCDISIEYGQDISYVEKVLNTELPLIRKDHPELRSEPQLLGVASLSPSSVDLRIIAECDECDIYTVTRILNREVLMIFYRNNINIPFPNVTVYQSESPKPGDHKAE